MAKRTTITTARGGKAGLTQRERDIAIGGLLMGILTSVGYFDKERPDLLDWNEIYDHLASVCARHELVEISEMFTKALVLFDERNSKR
jgi:hypothetical protein